MVAVGTPFGLYAVLVSAFSGLFSTIQRCASADYLSDSIGVAITQVLLTLVALVSALILTTIFAGPALLLALIISSLIFRIYNTLVLESLTANVGCR